MYAPRLGHTGDGMRAAIAIGMLAVAARVATGQAPATPPAAPVPPPAFEVTSVRPNVSGRSSQSMRWPADGRFQAVNNPLRRLIELAYDLRVPQQLMGAPGWIASERFDIEAIPAVQVDRPQQRLMLQGLLRDRFGLAMRAQPVGVPTYALMRTRPDAPLPPTFRPSTWTCGGRRDVPDCNVRVARGGGRMVGVGASIPSLIFVLASRVDRRIVDRTELPGVYDFDLTWSPNPVGAGRTTDAAIFTAIEELGLKLQPIMNPMTGYVIERIERPTPN